jgi:hypothetical protein
VAQGNNGQGGGIVNVLSATTTVSNMTLTPNAANGNDGAG